ncbi:MAG: nuclear transport factor 2 family protein [Blastomonas sp.]
MTIDSDFAYRFAQQWVAAWNAHDLDAILSHYAEDIVFLSPIAAMTVGNGRIEGKQALRSYWTRGLAARPDLHFRLEQILTGHDCLALLYRNQRDQQVSESFEFDGSGQVIRSLACYG